MPALVQSPLTPQFGAHAVHAAIVGRGAVHADGRTSPLMPVPVRHADHAALSELKRLPFVVPYAHAGVREHVERAPGAVVPTPTLPPGELRMSGSVCALV